MTSQSNSSHAVVTIVCRIEIRKMVEC